MHVTEDLAGNGAARASAPGSNALEDGGLTDLLSGADVGLALFDGDLRVVSHNRLYQRLCGYTSEMLDDGASMPDLMRLSLRRQGIADTDIDKTVEVSLSHLKPGADYAFRYLSMSGRAVEVRRRRLPNGSVVETVREVEASEMHDPASVQYEKIAETARTRMMQALDAMADGFSLYDLNDQLVVYNQKFLEINAHVADLVAPGVTYETLLRKGIERGGFVLKGMDTEEFIEWRLRQHRAPDDPYEVEYTDGRWILCNDEPCDDGSIVGIHSDITQLKRREQEILRISRELHSKNLHFDTALNNMIQGLCMFDGQQTLIVCNNRYREMYGFSPDVVKPGISLRQIMEYSVSIGNYTEEEAQRALAERKDPKRLAHRTTIKQRLKDGRVIAVMNEPMNDGGTIATYQDITELELHEQRQAEHLRQLERSNRELEDFAYVASHDLQEPLRKIEAFGDRLVRKCGDDLSDDGRMYIDRMQDAARRMRRLINDLLGYSRVTTKANPFVRVELNEVMSDVLSDLQIRIDEVKGTVEYGDLPDTDADESQIHQLFLNLIGNALKFHKPDVPPVVRVTIDVKIVQGRELLQIDIADNGIGFSNDYKEKIFTIFQRLHGRLEYEGTGIGLATCRKIVERHGGTIVADGVEGEGAQFTIVVPRYQASSEVA